MVEVKFKKKEDFTFMMLNLFVHDFLHDFNASKFASRLSKISSYIDKIRNEINSRTGKKPPEKLNAAEVIAEVIAEEKTEEKTEDNSKSNKRSNKQSKKEKKASDTKTSDTKASDTKTTDTKTSDTKTSDTKTSDAIEEKTSDTKTSDVIEEKTSDTKTSDEKISNEEDDTIDENILKEYECFDKNETGTNLNYLISNIDGIVQDDNINKINEVLNYKGSITRSKAKTMQMAKNFVDETKLYVLGLFNLNKIKEDLKYFGGRIKLFDPLKYNKHTKKHGNKKKHRRTKKITNENNVKNNIEINQININNNFYMLRNFVNNGFESAIHYSKDYKDLSDYFQFFGKLYIYYENKNMNPLDTFNLTMIEDILVLYLLDKEKKILNDKHLYNILDKYNELIQNKKLKETFTDNFYGGKTSDNQNKNEIFLGGTKEPQEIINDALQMIGEIDEKFPFFVGPENNFFDIFDKPNLGGFSIETIDYAKKIQEKNPDIIKKTKLNSFIETINKSKTFHLNSRPRSLETTKNAFIDSMNKLIIYIRQTFVDIKNDLITSMEKDNNKEKKLTAMQSSDVQRISISVARGGLEYILSKDYNKNEKKKNMLDYEYDIIKNIAENEKGFTNLDTKIRENFHVYSKNTGNAHVIDSNEELKKQIENILKKFGKDNRTSVINNAATSTLRDIFGDKFDKEVICPTSSYVDAMGSMGSCSGDEFKNHKKEFFNMDFLITNDEDENEFYQGNTLIVNKDGKKEVKITYSALCNEFMLPYVELIIDMSTTKVVTLSANNTFKSVINRILTIWNNQLDKIIDNEELLWEILINKRIYVDLISTGSLKGIGDFYQEINSTLEKGGYEDRNITKNYFVNHLRIGANGDQPSGIRAGFLLLNANTGIHENAIAGYLADENTIMISREPIIKGGSRKKISKKSNRKTRKK